MAEAYITSRGAHAGGGDGGGLSQVHPADLGRARSAR